MSQKYRWIAIGCGWPTPERAGFICVIGAYYMSGRARALFDLIDEKEDEDIETLCKWVLDFDHKYGPEFVFADKKADSAVAVLTRLNIDSRRSVVGMSYANPLDAPWHKKIISLSHASLFDMNEGYLHCLNKIRELLKAKDRRFKVPEDSRLLGRLQIVSSMESQKLEDNPMLAAVGVCLVELDEITHAEQVRQSLPPKRPPYDPLRYSQQRRSR